MRVFGLVVLAGAALLAGFTGCGRKALPPPESYVLGSWEGNLAREIDNHRFRLVVEFRRTHWGVLTRTTVVDRSDGHTYATSSYADVGEHAVGFSARVPDPRDAEPLTLYFKGRMEPGNILWGTYGNHFAGNYASFHNEDLGTWRLERK